MSVRVGQFAGLDAVQKIATTLNLSDNVPRGPSFFFSSRRRHTRSGLGIPAEPLFRSMKSRRGFAIQRLMNAMRQAHADGWFIVFDTLTLADDRLEAFYDNPNALRDYFRDIGRMVL